MDHGGVDLVLLGESGTVCLGEAQRENPNQGANQRPLSAGPLGAGEDRTTGFFAAEKIRRGKARGIGVSV